MSELYTIPAADERVALFGFIDFYRDALLRKIDGLNESQARWRPAPTANHLLGLVNHMAAVEDNWFQVAIMGRTVERDRETEFSPPDDLTVDQAVAKYRAAISRSDEVSAEVSPEQQCLGEWALQWNVRWVLLHMLEETARHAGHADITRELIDGATGH